MKSHWSGLTEKFLKRKITGICAFLGHKCYTDSRTAAIIFK